MSRLFASSFSQVNSVESSDWEVVEHFEVFAEQYRALRFIGTNKELPSLPVYLGQVAEGDSRKKRRSCSSYHSCLHLRFWARVTRKICAKYPNFIPLGKIRITHYNYGFFFYKKAFPFRTRIAGLFTCLCAERGYIHR